jgi:hypothetical protein
MHNGIPICELFSDPRPFACGDPQMHTVIPICKITHMGIKDLISRMRTTSLCIWGVTEKSLYAYRDAQIPVCIRGLVSIRSPYAPYAYVDQDQSPYVYGDYILIQVCIQGLHDKQSLYAYGN